MAQDRFTVAFDKNETEQKLFKWVGEKSVIIGKSNYTKQILYEKMIEDEKIKKISQKE